MYESTESHSQSVFRALEAEDALSATMARYYNPSIGKFTSEDLFTLGRPVIDLGEDLTEIETEMLLDTPDLEEYGFGETDSFQDQSIYGNVGLQFAYTYTPNNPVLYHDPYGENWVRLIAPIVKSGRKHIVRGAKAAWKICKNIRCRVRVDPDKHPFRFIGQRCHVRVTCFVKGRPNSTWLEYQFPVPCKFNKYQNKK